MPTAFQPQSTGDELLDLSRFHQQLAESTSPIKVFKDTMN